MIDNYLLEEILTVYRKCYASMISKDILALDGLLDANFYLIHMSGYKQDKKEWLDHISEERMKYFSAIEKYAEVSVDGEQAEVIAKNLVDARIEGNRNAWRLKLKMNIMKKENSWVIISAVASNY